MKRIVPLLEFAEKIGYDKLNSLLRRISGSGLWACAAGGSKDSAAYIIREGTMRALYFVPGLACLFIGVMFLLVYRRSIIADEAAEHSMNAQGWARLTDTGSRLEYNYENRSRTVYFGIYEYDTADGQHITSASDFGYGAPKDVPGTQGDMVKIRYNAKNPTEFALLEEQAISRSIRPVLKRIGIWMTILGILFTAAAAAVLLGFFDPILDGLMNQSARS